MRDSTVTAIHTSNPFMEFMFDNAAALLVDVEVAGADELEVESERREVVKADEGVIAGVVASVVAVDMGAELVLIVELPLVDDCPPVITVPEIGMALLMRVDVFGLSVVLEVEDEGDPPEMRAIAKVGLVLPESPIKTMR